MPGALVAPVLASWCRRCVAWRHRRARRRTAVRAGNDAVAFDRLRVWLRTDDEIVYPEQDLFGHSAVAHRMAERLAQSEATQLGRLPTFALIGPLGSGKSSVRRL